ncbi:glycosyltransferase [Deinococcus yavapaiensis]|uniref:Glycosyltransferase involved in cell wall biosynthesis n=1 Tax=Deinococcus yavapaiensis KR-236 TaxID=694435 RepID=A0A318S9S6_9DEIO|nr:glycosyltransferase [Deinococcus yavapaiensis]PYE55971.1 glycosyltransferase involved in cell wall biosynthesis [Deinococcus yavapaiensis KR-236]
MKIGIITATYAPSRNGVATSTTLFVKGLRALGHEVRVFAPEHPRRDAAASEEGVFRLPSTAVSTAPDYPVLLPWAASMLRRLPLRDLDVVHTMHPFQVGQAARGIARAIDVPLVYTAHTQYDQYLHYIYMPRRFGLRMIRRQVRLFAQSADAVLVPGTAMEEVLRRYKFKGRVTLMPNPIDFAAFASVRGGEARASLGIPRDVPLLVYLGRLGQEKNLPTLIEAFRSASTRLPGARLLIVGDGPLRLELERRARGLAVTFTGAVEYARVPAYLAAGDAFVTASTSEVLPMSMIEALAAGLPLVAAQSPAARDLIGSGPGGVLCAPTPASLAAGMVRVVTSARAAEARAEARAIARRYDVIVRSRELAGIYETVQSEQGAVTLGTHGFSP